jgi:hypothetical protein
VDEAGRRVVLRGWCECVAALLVGVASPGVRSGLSWTFSFASLLSVLLSAARLCAAVSAWAATTSGTLIDRSPPPTAMARWLQRLRARSYRSCIHSCPAPASVSLCFPHHACIPVCFSRPFLAGAVS